MPPAGRSGSGMAVVPPKARSGWVRLIIPLAFAPRPAEHVQAPGTRSFVRWGAPSGTRSLNMLPCGRVDGRRDDQTAERSLTRAEIVRGCSLGCSSALCHLVPERPYHRSGPG